MSAERAAEPVLAAAAGQGAGEGRYVGRAIPRVENLPLLTGRGCYVDDVERAGQVHACIVRSDVAHGRIVSVSAEAARRLPGVVDVVTGRELPDVRIPVRMMPSPEAAPVTQAPLARDTVRYVGEPVAVVVAEDAYAAEDAAAAVEIEIEELAPVLDAFEAAAPEARPLHSEALSGNVVNRLRARHGRDVDELLAAADVLVRDRLGTRRQSALPLETRGLVAELDPGTGRLTVWGPTKVKHFNRALLAKFLDMPEQDVRLVEPDVGGGFGARGEFYPEDFLVPWLAVRLRRPVKWAEDRREHFLAINHSREVWCDIELGMSGDGTLLGFRARCLVDQGAYARTHGAKLLPWIFLNHLPGPYAWAGFEIEAASVLTNKTPAGTYRGPSQYESAFFRERMIDRAAGEASLDPAELRRRNLVPVESMPYTMHVGDAAPPIVYDGGDFPLILDTLLTRAGYRELRKRAERRRAGGELVGVGISAHVEAAAFGRYEHARVTPRTDGSYVAHVGVASLGQGVRTVLAQILADELGVPIERVEISHRDTDLVPQGLGSYASRSTVIGGGAVLGAVEDLRLRAVEAAAERLEIAEHDLEVVPGGIVRPRGQPTGGIPLAELGCDGACRYDKPTPSFDMGAMLAVVAIDRDTGRVAVERLLICHDVGRMVNPKLVDGQLVGAAAQGVGGALLEHLTYGPEGQPMVTSFMDYLMPTAAEVPLIEALALELPHHDPETEHPLGVKGCGESGVIGAGAAIANAVADAVADTAGGDRRVASILPLTPEGVLALVGAGDRTVTTAQEVPEI
jgi:carbon-monoxide dehydrogenase large subunit